MKKIFSLFLVCCTAFVFADDEPIFEETDENVKMCAYPPFVTEDPVFEEDSKTCNENDAPDQSSEDPSAWLLQLPGHSTCRIEPPKNPCTRFSYTHWPRFKANFGMEKLFLRFPQRPAVSKSNTLLTAYAYDNGILYSVTGYFPPIGNINSLAWFDEILYSVDRYPFNLISHVIYQVANGDWVMDYSAHDYVQNLIMKARAIVTPFNGYTLQCVKPNGARDYFDYFLDNFYIRCECHK